ncbi:proteasome assembly chaperone 3-like [Diadema setosum]|uniref:proteasome assembly chaperone 3-like n=1 Tax=Diadema setosum TaxID=31175 RepID=UPI003B3A1C3F
MESQKGYPTSKTGAVTLDGRHTDFVLTPFEDRSFLVVTQYQKLGTLIHVTKDSLPLDKREETYSTHVLLGRDEPVIHVFARNIASQVLKSESKPLLLSLALEDYSPAVLKGIQKVIENYLL